MSVTVLIEPSGHQISVELGETVLEAALRQGVALAYGCRNGACGTCMGELLQGEVDYPSGKTNALDGQGPAACLLCQAVPRGDLRCRVAEIGPGQAPPPRLLPCRVDRREQLAHDVVRIYLKLPEGQRLQFLAGQYLEFILRDGRRRAFSIANAPHDDAFIELHVRHVEGGAFTDHVFSAMEEKEILRIQAPLGSFTVREQSSRPLLFVAGGTGFAPIKGMLEHAFYAGLQRPMLLYWGVRSRRDLYLPDLPDRWAQEHPEFQFTPVLSEPDADWHGRRGFVHEAVLADHPDISEFDVYLAGPPVMVEAGRKAFEAAGLAREHMVSDAFEYGAAK